MTNLQKYALSGLARFLNEKVGTKKSGRSFTPQDVQQYCLRGHLPKYLGGAILKVHHNELTGMKFIQVCGEVKLIKQEHVS